MLADLWRGASDLQSLPIHHGEPSRILQGLPRNRSFHVLPKSPRVELRAATNVSNRSNRIAEHLALNGAC